MLLEPHDANRRSTPPAATATIVRQVSSSRSMVLMLPGSLYSGFASLTVFHWNLQCAYGALEPPRTTSVNNWDSSTVSPRPTDYGGLLFLDSFGGRCLAHNVGPI